MINYDKEIQLDVEPKSSSDIRPGFGRCSGNYREIARSSSKVSVVCREFARSSPKVSRAYQEFGRSLSRVVGGLLGVCRELVEGDREFAGSSPKVIGSLPGMHRGFARR
ncbi:hypothetical protein BHM03_00037269 [Ensete ventricosum]|nr:hypothetical protein BHM03_00037269 [Ensete ventricosum]